MFLNLSSLIFSASDLSNFLSCRHLSQLDRRVANGRLVPPEGRDPGLVLLHERGLAHEKAYLDHLRSQGIEVVDLRTIEAADTAVERTLLAMRSGAAAIAQGALRGGCWNGQADILRRVEQPSDLGPWSYEVVDTKLAQRTRGGTVLQLALYNDLLSQHLGHHPEHMHVVQPGPDFPRESFRWHDFAAYYRRQRRAFEASHLLEVESSEVAPSTYPLPVPRCDTCRWWPHCHQRWHDDDHLCLVAGIRNLHIGELKGQGIETLSALAEADQAIAKPERGSLETYRRLQRQASAQLTGRRNGAPFYALREDLVSDDPPTGLARLPEPSAGDIFFDFEADPFIDDGGLEYLFGWATRNDDGSFDYQALWSYDRQQERQAFERFVEVVTARLELYPDLHIYHFSPYEPSALKRLMGRHARCEEAIDGWLRSERFVDLLAVTRQGLWASVEHYSLKELEPFYDFRRPLDLAEAARALQHFAWALELGDPSSIADEDAHRVEQYNREDCLSTAALRDWLEERRLEAIAAGLEMPRPPSLDAQASDQVQAAQAEVQVLVAALTDDLPPRQDDFNAGQQGCLLLAHLLDYFRRENKSSWWEFFRLRDLDEDALFDERKAVSGLQLVEEIASSATGIPVHRYTFPEQEVALKVGKKAYAANADPIGSVYGIDFRARTLDLKKTRKTADAHPQAIFSVDVVPEKPLDQSLLGLAREIVADGSPATAIEGAGRFQAIRDLLLRHPPRRNSPSASTAASTSRDASLRRPGETSLAAAKRLLQELDGGVLPIQGPPGSGKTYLGARLVVDLIQRGLRVGVTATSHKVIHNLLSEVLEAARQEGMALEVTHKISSRAKIADDDRIDGFHQVKDNGQALAAIGNHVVGGVAWLWARDDAVETLDVLVVDEAGQMSLAHVLAAGRCARNLVLLGDPQQLQQPQRGSHPEGADIAALEHLLGGERTVPRHRGLFLDTTWRLSPAICQFTSELYYEGRLSPEATMGRQRVRSTPPFDGTGLYFVGVEHHGHQSTSPAEVEAVAQLVDRLLTPEATWVDHHGAVHPLTPDDLLVVAPFNAHVAALSSRLPQLSIGTVDRFQGQQAPIVIYSLASSSIEDAPRGMAFLLDPHRLNVATSRARCLVILVASPRLLEAECRSPEMMRWANGLCRFGELADEVDL